MVLSLRGLASHVPPGVPILYDAGLGFGWNDPRGWRVYFGVSANDVELKMRVYESLAEFAPDWISAPSIPTVYFAVSRNASRRPNQTRHPGATGG